MNYYTYKITFKDLPCYFYYGKHKDNGKPYFGSPATWKHLWYHFEPEVHILQWYGTEEEVYAAEEAIIRATWDSKYSLNEAVGACVSVEVCRKNGKKNIKAMNDHPNTAKSRIVNAKALNIHPNTRENRVKTGKNFPPEIRSENGKKTVAANLDPHRSDNGKRTGGQNRKAVTCVETGVEYPSMRCAAVTTGLERRLLWACCNGRRKTTGGFHWRYA